MSNTNPIIASLFVVLSASLAIGCGSDEPDAPRGAAGSSGSGGTGGSGPGEDAAAGSAGSDAGTDAADSGPSVADYSDPAFWLCLPSASTDYCRENLDATVLRADGTTTVEPHTFAQNPTTDCFYVYPTISSDVAANSDFIPDDLEKNVVREQAARLSRECAVYAPIYRQNTVASLFNPDQFTVPIEERRAIAYGDVVKAWQHYLTNFNKSRPFVLIGHSQGTGVLRRLIQEQIDGDAELRARLVSALLIGGDVVVPEGADVGGDFQNIPLCRAPTDTGCAVAYSAFRSTAGPPANSRFGKPRAGMAGRVACNNPAALAGGSAVLNPYYRVGGGGFPNPPAVSTRYIAVPSFIRGECVYRDGYSFLEITVTTDPADQRPDDIGGDLTPDWGLHLVDVHLAMGDLVTLVKAQIAAF
jgi:hypothetical protein